MCSVYFHYCAISEHIPSEGRLCSNLQIYAQTLDVLLFTFDQHFSSNNTALGKAMEALSPTSNKFMDFGTLKPHYEYSVTSRVTSKGEQSSTSSLNSSISEYFSNHNDPKKNADSLFCQSLVSILSSLAPKKNRKAKSDIQNLLYDIEFTDD